MPIVFNTLAAMNASTANATSYIGNTGNSSDGELLLCGVTASATVAAGSMTGGGLTWTKLTSFTRNAGADTQYFFWTAAITGNAITPIFDCTGDAASGACLMCYRISGTESNVVPSIRQWRTSGASTTNPSVVMYAQPLSGNGMIGFAANGTNSATQWTAPANWTENGEATYTTTANSFEAASVVITGSTTTITWTNANVTAWGVIAMEFWNPHARSAGGGAGGNSPMFY